MKKKSNIFKKTTSIRGRNKIRKEVYLGLDDVKKKLYAWDYVMLTAPMEMNSSWISRIYWNALDGAFVDSHPGHKAMGIGGGHRDLSPFMSPNNKYDISHLFHPEPGTFISRYSIKKVTYQEYINWKIKTENKKKENEIDNDE